jgi:hypothetical protein
MSHVAPCDWLDDSVGVLCLEVSELVTSTNRKYNEMLAERMAVEDNLLQEIERLKKLLEVLGLHNYIEYEF